MGIINVPGVEESWTRFAQILILSSAFLVYLIGAAELSLVHLFVLWGALLVVGSSNWVLIYLGLEMQTFSILILLGRARGAYGLEGGLKYFILNGVFSGCLLLGLAYLYSQSGEVYMEGQMYLGLKFEWGYVFFGSVIIISKNSYFKAQVDFELRVANYAPVFTENSHADWNGI